VKGLIMIVDHRRSPVETLDPDTLDPYLFPPAVAAPDEAGEGIALDLGRVEPVLKPDEQALREALAEIATRLARAATIQLPPDAFLG
jgi:hypothetical protein